MTQENKPNPQEKEKDLEVLSHIERNDTPLRQRDIAELAGLSLGMTNAVLKRLAAKGWLKIKRINSRKVQYAVTPAGTAEVARRSRRLLKTTLKSIAQYRDAIDRWVQETKNQGYTTICLTRTTEIDFIVEWACERHGLTLRRTPHSPSPAETGAITLDPEEPLAEINANADGVGG